MPRSSSPRAVTLDSLLALAIAALLLALLAGVLASPLRINMAAAMYLQAGALLLDGYLPYVDIFDNNPPLIFYISAAIVALANALSASMVITFQVLVWIFTVASVLATWRHLRRALPDDSFAAALVAGTQAAYGVLLYARTMYGDREHLFMLAFMPYLALRFRAHHATPPGGAASLLTGAAVGLAASLKPHFVVVLFAVEAYWLLSRRSWRSVVRPETVALSVVGLAYALHFLLMPDAVRTAFFDELLPLLQRFQHVHLSWTYQLVAGYSHWIAGVAAVIVLLVRPARDTLTWKLAPPLAITAAMGMASYFYQAKGYDYHAIPIDASALALAAVVVAVLRPIVLDDDDPAPGAFRLQVPPSLLRSALLLVVGALGAGVAVLLVRMDGSAARAGVTRKDAVAAVLAEFSRAGDPVLVLSATVGPQYPAMTQLDRRPGTRFLWLPVALLYADVAAGAGQPFPYRSAADAIPEERRFLAQMREDLARRRPVLIMVPAAPGCYACPTGFSLAEYGERAGWFGRGDSGDYVLAGVRGAWLAYTRR